MSELRKPCILIADDQPVNIQILSAGLEKEYDLKVATDGLAALKIACMPDNGPDLILLDVLMPEMDGYEVCRRLKEEEGRVAEIPVIFISALDSVSEESRGLSLGAVDYITKPFNIDIVKLRVKNHLALKRQRDRLQSQKAQLIDALNKVRFLSGMLPICSSCKKIRDDKGYWNQLEAYIEDHAEVSFSHGICPDCIRTMYPDLAETILKSQEAKNITYLEVAGKIDFDQILRQEWKRGLRDLKHLSLLFIRVNLDKEKHAGLLRDIEALIRGIIQRPGDCLACLEAGLCALLLPDTDEAGVRFLADRVLRSLMDVQTKVKARGEADMLFSLGTASMVPQVGYAPDILVSKALRELEGED